MQTEMLKRWNDLYENNHRLLLRLREWNKATTPEARRKLIVERSMRREK